ncbi:chaperone modulator CbpM [Candidatus Thiodictyon syntrophicum]|jgi:chaperone modulatory protein CbpM|uniref:MerR family transcriptional regulator n=1 Tax=Candidatus Thiodictyon syntrophicum TaxID=1166950 RepID=A0A2K8U2W0_9GAMM|nr:chaperone modulator CbpM [Candidatus Thiodictyon syntrophicum]AUB79920.1 MerR family transcriptional regulator [Candidatus Thiodictyon syntrophicum]
MVKSETRIEGVVMDEGFVVTLAELTQLCGSSGRTLQLLVGEGVLRPRAGGAPGEWRFDGVAVQRARRALRLRHDLELNLSGTALALDLLDELEALRERIRALEHQLGTLGGRDRG